MTRLSRWLSRVKMPASLPEMFHPSNPISMSTSSNVLLKAASALKVQLARQAGRLVGTERELTLRFEKDDWGGWFAIIPSRPLLTAGVK